MRLDKYISRYYGVTRSESKKLIRKGLVKVDAVIVKNPDQKVAGSSVVLVGDTLVDFYDTVYVAMNKPTGYVCSRDCSEGNTIFSLVDRNFSDSLSVAGRLDKDSTGLVVLSNDGEFIHRVITPKKDIEKEYIVGLENEPTRDLLSGLVEGVDIGNGEFAKAREVSIQDDRTIRIVLTEGKYHEIKRMAVALGSRVTSINRIRIGDYRIPGGLGVGEWILLGEADIKKIIGE